MEYILEKLIFEKQITKEDIYNALYEVCDREHSSCNDDCPVYRIQKDNCSCFKNGKAMYEAIKGVK